MTANLLTVREHVEIAVPVEDVFAYVDESAHQIDLSPSLTRWTLLEQRPNGGRLMAYTYQIFGLSFSGEMRTTDYVPHERIVWAMTGDLRGTLRWYFSPTNREECTRFTYAATYAFPGPSLLHSTFSPLVQRYTAREVQTLLQRLKKNIETQIDV